MKGQSLQSEDGVIGLHHHVTDLILCKGEGVCVCECVCEYAVQICKMVKIVEIKHYLYLVAYKYCV